MFFDKLTTPYRYAFNNPISIIDPDGNQENEPCDMGGNCNDNGKFGYYELGPGASLNGDGSVSGSLKGSGDPVKGKAKTEPNNDGTVTVTVGGLSYTTKALPKIGSTSTFIGNGFGMGKTLIFNKSFWMGKNFRLYNHSFNGNLFTGGKFKFSRNLFKSFGRISTFLNFVSIGATEYAYSNGKISSYRRATDQIINGIGFLGAPGAAFNFGFNLGYVIEDFCDCNIQVNFNNVNMYNLRHGNFSKMFEESEPQNQSIFSFLK